MTHSSGGRKSKVMVQAWSGEGPYPGCRLLVVPSWGERTREFYGIPFIRALILIMRAKPKGHTFLYHIGYQDFNIWIWGSKTFRPQQQVTSVIIFRAQITFQEFFFYQFFVYLSYSSGILYFFFSTYPHSKQCGGLVQTLTFIAGQIFPDYPHMLLL